MKYMIHMAGWLVVTVGCLWLWSGIPVQAAEFQSADIYTLPADAVVTEDLFVVGNEIIIEGTVEGDLFAAGSTIVIRGDVQGSAYLAAYAVVIQGSADGTRGRVQGDLLGAAYSLILDGTIGEDIRAAVGGMLGPNIPIPYAGDAANSASMEEFLPRLHEGLVVTSRARIGGEILAATNLTTLEGHVERDVMLATEQYMQADTSHIGGNLRVEGGSQVNVQGSVQGDLDITAQSVTLSPNLTVGGSTRYTAAAAAATPPGNAVFTPLQANPTDDGPSWQDWLLRTVLIVVGFTLLLVLFRVVRSRSAEPPRHHLGMVLVWGILSLFLMPIALILLPAVTGLFLGVGQAFVVAGVIGAGWAALWIFSPLLAGRRLGTWLRAGLPGETPTFGAELLGVVLVILLVRLSSLPTLGLDLLQNLLQALGWIVFSLCYLVAAGSLIQGWSAARRTLRQPESESNRVPA